MSRSFEGLNVTRCSSMRHIRYLENYCRRTGARDILDHLGSKTPDARASYNKMLGELFMPHTLGEVDTLCAQIIRFAREAIRDSAAPPSPPSEHDRRCAEILQHARETASKSNPPR